MVAEVGADELRLEEVHRFPNGGVRHDDGSLRWDIERIHRELLVGLRAAAASGPVDSIGIDSWAIDYGLVDEDGRLLGAPYSHRDGRTDGVREKVVGRARRVSVVRRDGDPAAAVQHALPARGGPGLGRLRGRRRRCCCCPTCSRSG